MCNDISFEDLHDLPELEECRDSKNQHTENIGGIEVPGFTEDCPKCRGTGNWRPGYPCFKCKGTGKLHFKTSPDARGKARKSARKRKDNQLAANFDRTMASLDADVREWLTSNRESNSFAASICEGIAKYGNMTEGQINAVRKAIARDSDAAAGIAVWAEQNEAEYNWLTTEADNGNEFAGSLLSALKRYGNLTDGQFRAVQKNLDKAKDFAPSDIDISSLKGYYAVPDGDSRLKLCVRRPGKNSRWYGWTYVDDGAAYGSRQTYGKQAPEGTYQGKVQDALRKILENPLEAQIAYGKLTGTCGYCGRMLEDEQSVARGIGPICAAKYS